MLLELDVSKTRPYCTDIKATRRKARSACSCVPYFSCWPCLQRNITNITKNMTPWNRPQTLVWRLKKKTELPQRYWAGGYCMQLLQKRSFCTMWRHIERGQRKWFLARQSRRDDSAWTRIVCCQFSQRKGFQNLKTLYVKSRLSWCVYKNNFNEAEVDALESWAGVIYAIRKSKSQDCNIEIIWKSIAKYEKQRGRIGEKQKVVSDVEKEGFRRDDRTN